MAGPQTHAAPSAPSTRRVSGATLNAQRVASDVRQAILIDLRRNVPSSADDVGDRLRASRGAVLQQLRALEAAGLAVRESVRHGVGRPRHRYDVTADAQGLLPSNYDGLATGVIGAIEAVG